MRVTFESAADKYYTTLAEGKTRKLEALAREGIIKLGAEPKRSIPKIPILLIALIIAGSFTYVVAQWYSSSQMMTEVHVPISILKPSVTIPDIWANSTGSWIETNYLTLNTGNKLVTYTLKGYGTLKFANGTETETLSRIFDKATITVNDGTKNLTRIDLLASQSTTFQYQVAEDVAVRLIIEYETKDVQLGATRCLLTVTILYAYASVT